MPKIELSKIERSCYKFDWSDKQCEIVIGYMRKYPGNLTHAFKLASAEIGLNYRSIMGAWYRKGSPIKAYLKTTSTPCLFFTYMERDEFANRKNIFVEEIEE